MGYHFPANVAALVRERMATGRYSSEEELLCAALESLAEQEEDLDAVRSAIAEMQAGDPGLSLEAAFEEVVSRHRLRQDQ